MGKIIKAALVLFAICGGIYTAISMFVLFLAYCGVKALCVSAVRPPGPR